MARVKFTAQLVKRRQQLCFDLPQEVSSKLGHTGRIPVTGTLNTFPINTSVFPTDGEGDGHFMTVARDVQKLAGLSVGSTVKVVLEVDQQPTKVDVPGDMEKALENSAAARKAYDRLSHSHQKEYVDWIEEAKRPETRARRIEKTIERLLESPSG